VQIVTTSGLDNWRRYGWEIGRSFVFWQERTSDLGRM